jgi:hypothetical protein
MELLLTLNHILDNFIFWFTVNKCYLYLFNPQVI